MTITLNNAALVEGHIKSKALEAITLATDLTDAILRDAQESFEVAEIAAAKGKLNSALKNLEDAARLAGTAVLQLQGLRPTSENGHHALVIELLGAQFKASIISRDVIAGLHDLRRRRNALAYPTAGDQATAAEVESFRSNVETLLKAVTVMHDRQLIPPFRG